MIRHCFSRPLEAEHAEEHETDRPNHFKSGKMYVVWDPTSAGGNIFFSFNFLLTHTHTHTHTLSRPPTNTQSLAHPYKRTSTIRTSDRKNPLTPQYHASARGPKPTKKRDRISQIFRPQRGWCGKTTSGQRHHFLCIPNTLQVCERS